MCAGNDIPSLDSPGLSSPLPLKFGPLMFAQFLDAYISFGALIYFSNPCKVATKHIVHPVASVSQQTKTPARTILQTWMAKNTTTERGDHGGTREVTLTMSIGFKADVTQRLGGSISGGRTTLVVPTLDDER